VIRGKLLRDGNGTKDGWREISLLGVLLLKEEVQAAHVILLEVQVEALVRRQAIGLRNLVVFDVRLREDIQLFVEVTVDVIVLGERIPTLLVLTVFV